MPSDLKSISEDPEFKKLIRDRVRFVIPSVLIFVIYYFALPLLVGYAPEFMATPVMGPVNIAYLFALSQFFMAWTIAALYVRAARRFDAQNKKILDRHS